MTTLDVLHQVQGQCADKAAKALLENMIDTAIGIWPPNNPVCYQLIKQHAENALVWRTATDYWEFDMKERID